MDRSCRRTLLLPRLTVRQPAVFPRIKENNWRVALALMTLSVLISVDLGFSGLKGYTLA